jgi:putative transposase
MPRHTRLVLPDVPLHLIQRGSNRLPCFFEDSDRIAYLEWLMRFAPECGCRVHAYVLMSNHVHLLLSAAEAAGVARLMKALGQHYAHYFNQRYHRTGSMWNGRYKSCLVQQERYLLVCQRYIELNPVRAGMVQLPAQYRWSSYRANAEGRLNALLQPHEVYLRLGGAPEQRQAAYRALFQQPFPQQAVDQLRIATNNDFAVGDQAFLRRAVAARGKA